MTRVRVELDAPAGLLPLSAGTYVIGRSETCDVVIESGRASREHARLVVTDTGATLEDLGSANGTFVNGERLSQPRELAHQDFIVIGDVAIDIMITPATEDAPDPQRPSVVMRAGRGEHQTSSTSNVAVHEVLEGLSNTQLAAGDVTQAERTLSGWLARTLTAALADKGRDRAAEAAALRCSVRLAVATLAAPWVDYVVSLAAATRQPIGASEATSLGPAIERVGVARSALDGYLKVLNALGAEAPPTALAAAERWSSRAVDR